MKIWLYFLLAIKYFKYWVFKGKNFDKRKLLNENYSSSPSFRKMYGK
jgi:hypothetical protein